MVELTQFNLKKRIIASQEKMCTSIEASELNKLIINSSVEDAPVLTLEFGPYMN